MRSLLRHTLLLASVLVACGGFSGCSNEPETDTGKMGGPTNNMEKGKMGGPMDKMETGKMNGPMDKMETGKMNGPMDKMEKGKME